MKITYNSEQLTFAAEFISKHNPNNFSLMETRNTIYGVMYRMKADLIKNLTVNSTSTMGFTIQPYNEGDDNWIFEILVDPILGNNDYSGDLHVEL